MTSISGLFSSNLYASIDTKANQTNQLLPSTSQNADAGKETAEQLASYMLDLSEQAKAYLMSQQQKKDEETAPGTAADGFILTSAEQKQLREIIEKYKDAPLTPETFKQIQEELTAKGIGADQLAAKEQIRGFNSTQIFLDALAGTQTAMGAEQVGAAVQTKKENYLTDIIEYWASISTAETSETGNTDA